MSSLIGASPPRPDAWGKVTGEAAYPADLIRPGMLHLQVVFAHRPHARIRSINCAAARAHPGVVAVLTADDVPHNAYGLIQRDQPVLCSDVVRYVGDRVALVVAESKRAAIAGAELVQVDYEDLPAVTDARAALAPGTPLVHAERGSNLLYHIPIRKGDTCRALAAADVAVEGDYATTWQEHAFLQPEAGIAYVDERDRLIVETAGQWLHEDRRQIAEILDLPEEQVVVRYATIGGAFGGREDLSVQHLLALAAWKLRRPVALVWSREESLLGHHKRHPMHIQCRWGACHDGRIVALEAEVLADGGAYASTSEEVIKVATLLAGGCYEIPNIRADGYVVYTNNLPSGAFRGFGAPQAQFAAELMLDRLAEKLGMDPLELRRRNLYRQQSIEPTQYPLPPGVSAPAVFERCVAEVRERWGADTADTAGMATPPGDGLPAHIRRGTGVACGLKNIGYSFGFPEHATASVELRGRLAVEQAIVRIGAADVGQGSHQVLRQIAAETLQLPLECVEMVCDDSSSTPNAGSASASRLTSIAGRAVKEAADAALADWQRGEPPARATVRYGPPPTTPLDSQTTAGRPNIAYGYAAQAVRVEVNTHTGQVKVLGVISVHDVGRIINRQMLEGQIEGCVVQALGYALLEEFQMKGGAIVTPSFSTYLLPTALDIPDEIVPVFLETPDISGPYGARGVAEMAMVAVAPAVAIAIHDATGVWLDRQPMTPPRVLAALAERHDG